MKRQITIISITLICGIFLGWIFFHSSPKVVTEHQHSTEEKIAEIWTCSMHPQIRMDKPGKCPICAMDLILVRQNGMEGSDPSAIHLSKEGAQLANVMTSIVTTQNPVKEVRLYGKVQADERLLQSQVSYIPGRIEKLFVNFTGESVRKGQPLATIYSPELITAQQELIEAARSKKQQPEIYEAAKEKLMQWKLTADQVFAIENSGKVQANMVVSSTANGIVTARRVNTGDYVNQGTVLFEVSDLSTLWVQFDAYESDLQFLNKGNNVEFTIQALPGENYSGKIIFIDQIIDPVTRIAKVRVEISNRSGKLKPEMFATGIVKANLEQYKDHLIIPRSAVLWTGKRSVVYVKILGNDPTFKLREIGLGPVLGNSFVVTDGLVEGEEIVTEGAFSVDAAAQLEGKPSMMNSGSRSTDGVTQSHPVSLAKNDQNSSLKQLSIKVSGNCEMCKDRIESAAKLVTGVVSAKWNSSDKILSLQVDPVKTNSDAIQKAIATTGHDTELYKAPDEQYKKLPECCLYRK